MKRQHGNSILFILVAISLLYVAHSATSAEEKKDNYVVHIVSEGDTLHEIAARYSTTIAVLIQMNHLKGLFMGQSLKVPAFTVTVSEGNSLWILAKKYHISVAQLKKANLLRTNRIRMGMKLIIPKSQSSLKKGKSENGKKRITKEDGHWTIMNKPLSENFQRLIFKLLDIKSLEQMKPLNWWGEILLSNAPVRAGKTTVPFIPIVSYSSGEETLLQQKEHRVVRSVSILVEKGIKVYSLTPGTVIKADSDGKRGKFAQIATETGFLIRYEHLGKLKVKKGKSVTANQLIGETGKIGLLKLSMFQIRKGE